MKLQEIAIHLVEGGTGSGRPGSKDRPNTNLWFKQRDLWFRDLQREHGNSFDMVQTEDEESGDIFATDAERMVCYGAWRTELDQGITFANPLPLQAVVGPRRTLKQMMF